MNLKEYEGFKISGSLSDHFQLQGLISELPLVDIYRAKDKKSGGMLRLIISKQRYEISNAAARLGNHVSSLKEVGLVEPFSFGVDDNGFAVIAVPLFDGHHIGETGKDSREIERRVLSVLKIVSKICLLYTSPSPRDRTRSRMPSSA